VVEPISLVPVFASLTEGANAAYRKRMAIKSVLVAGLIIIGFALSGAAFLDAMGISIDSFRIFGGAVAILGRARDGVRARIWNSDVDG